VAISTRTFRWRVNEIATSSSEICEIHALCSFCAIIIFVAHLASHGGIWARRSEWERRPGRFSALRRAVTLVRPLPVASTPYSSDTESADAESTPANRNQYHAGLLRRGLLSVKSFCRRAVSNASIAPLIPLSSHNVFKSRRSTKNEQRTRIKIRRNIETTF